MKSRCITVAALLAVAVSVPAASFAGDDKSLQNVKGSVSYQAPNAAVVPVALKATIPLADEDYAITGGESLAALNLPDSSQVMVGSDSKVQLAFFNRADIATAKFVVYDGRVRFAVRHPQGAKADYTFQTPTGTVAVRGTQGDVAYGADGALRVNVYEVCDPNKPVVITAKDGTKYTLTAGQSLLAEVVNGIVRAQVQQLTQQLIDQFSPDFGVPTSWDAAKGEVVGYAQNQATGAVNSVTGGYGGQLVPNVGGLFGKKAKPSPSPGPSTCN